jgi:hypothetical protein
VGCGRVGFGGGRPRLWADDRGWGCDRGGGRILAPVHMRAMGLVVIVLVSAGCDAGPEAQPARTTVPSLTAAPAPSSPAAASPRRSADIAAGTVSCADVIGAVPAPDPDLTVIGDAVAVPAATGSSRPLQVSADHDARTGAKLFAKTGLVVRRGAEVRLRVLAPAVGRAWIGWGSSGVPGRQAVVDGCDGSGAWIAFAGGYWVRSPMCVPLGIRVAGGAEHRVDIPVGTPCRT